MTEIMLAVLGVCCVAGLLGGLRRPEGLIELPTLCSLLFGGFILPQLYGASQVQGISPAAIQEAATTAVLCLGAIFLGYGLNNKGIRAAEWRFEPQKLVAVSWFLTIVGVVMMFALSNLEQAELRRGQWTGSSTILQFFSQLLHYGLITSLIGYLQSRDRKFLPPVLIGLLLLADKAIFGGRRSQFAFIGVTLLCSYWLVRRKTLPRPMIVGGFALGIVLLLSISVYRRSLSHGEGLKSSLLGSTSFNLEKLTVDEIFKGVQHSIAEQPSEGIRCCLAIQMVDESGSFDFGISHWNALVFGFVPGQLLGHEFKQSLMINPGHFRQDSAAYQMYAFYNGASKTGVADAYESFWYFGAFKFFLVAYFMRGLYNSAMLRWPSAQILYISLLIPSLWCIAHSTHMFVNRIVMISILVVPLLYWARQRQEPARAVVYSYS
ncbi:MAG: hypothetical protein KF688_10860 [Pirellulales bacterium]|nr:hypothetical protein [Pirellulales bacterium]